MLSWLQQALTSFYSWITGALSAILDLGLALWYVIVGVVGIAALVLQIVLQLGNVALSAGLGLVATVQGITAPAASRFPVTAFSAGWQAAAGLPGVDTMGYVAAGLIWILVAVALLRLGRGGT